MKRIIESIPHDQQRYETVGDYWFDDLGVLHFRVSDMGNEDFEFLVLIHELLEEHNTRRRGLKEPDIKAFDELYEIERNAGLHANYEEPGFDPRAPYLREHTLSTGVEMMLAAYLGVKWSDYEAAVESLSFPPLKMKVDGVEVPGI